jgi:hypothetical protein
MASESWSSLTPKAFNSTIPDALAARSGHSSNRERGLLLALLLLVSEHPGELLEQGAASLRDPVDRLQPLECTIYVWYTSCTRKRCPGDTTKSW